MSRTKFLCLDCQIDTGKIGEHYMLVDETWNKIHTSSTGMLCIACIEKRLGRSLNAHDFNDSYLNNYRVAPKSARLIDRMKTLHAQVGIARSLFHHTRTLKSRTQDFW